MKLLFAIFSIILLTSCNVKPVKSDKQLNQEGIKHNLELIDFQNFTYINMYVIHDSKRNVTCWITVPYGNSYPETAISCLKNEQQADIKPIQK